MSRNPIIAFGIIASLGILLMFGASFFGLNQAENLAAGDAHDEEQGAAEAATPEDIYAQSCLMCHGQDLEGGAGPALTDLSGKLDAAQIKDIIVNGQGSMPGGLVDAAKAEQLATWLLEQH